MYWKEKTMRVSISQIKLFKACRRAYELRYIYGMQPVEKAEPLETGISYHKKLEQMYQDEGCVNTEDFSKESAMACAYAKYIYPRFYVESCEKWFEYELPDGDNLIGRLDGIAEDGRLVEHKTTSQEIGENYEYDLMWDEQVLAYMLATGSRKMWYTICRKPTIRQKKGESDAEFFQRMVEWYDTDTSSKIRLLLVERTDEEVEQFRRDLASITDAMKKAERVGEFYKNCLHCFRWGRRCEYASICLNFDPEQEYIEFRRREDE
jgi:hypothetical protein